MDDAARCVPVEEGRGHVSNVKLLITWTEERRYTENSGECRIMELME